MQNLLFIQPLVMELDGPLSEDYATQVYSPKYNQGHLTYAKLLQLWH